MVTPFIQAALCFEVYRMKKLIVIFLALLLLFSVALAEEARTLQYGDKGEDVLTLQTRMKELLYYNGPLSGEFGDLTRKAVRRVQEAYDLEQTGAADCRRSSMAIAIGSSPMR